MNLQINHLIIPKVSHLSEWDTLMTLSELNLKYGPKLTSDQQYWYIDENLEDLTFHLERNKLSNQRKTLLDPLGCIGFSCINKNDDRVYLTEGVSDYFTIKLTHPTMNVLGLTTLGGSLQTKKLISALFNRICIVSDNDYNSKINTGLENSSRMRKFYESLGKKVKVLLPEPGFKDITEQFISDLAIVE